MLRDKDDKDDIAEDNRDSHRPLNEVNSDKPSIKHKTNKVSDIQFNENHIEEPKRQKKKIHFNNDVKVKDSPNHGFTLDKICDDSLRSEMGFTIEEIADPSGDEENPAAAVSARFPGYLLHLSFVTN